MSIRNSFLVYEVLRKAFLLGLRVKPILEALDLQPGEKVLDAGCGYGYFYRFCKEVDYTGIDFDQKRVDLAKEKLGESDQRRFMSGDLTSVPFEGNAFDKTIAYGLLHHLPTAEARAVLKKFAASTKDRIVFSDPVYTKLHWVNNRLCDLDKGNHVRTLEQYQKINEGIFAKVDYRFFYARNGLAVYLLQTAYPHS